MSRVGDVVIPTSGETPDEIATATCIMVSNVILAGDLNIYRNSTIDGRFISYIINHVINGDISRIAQGKSVVHIKASELAKLRINYPSRQEQNKIINFFMLLNRKITKQQSLINALKTYKRGVFSVLLNTFSKYETLLLENCASIKKGEQLNKTDMIKNGKYYVLNGGVAASGRTDNFNTDKNTISISEGGNSCGFVLFNTEKFWSGGHCYTLQNLKQNINNQYLFHYLKFHEKQIMSLRVGSGLPNIQKSELEKFEVLLPSADIQNKIANIMSNITAYENVVKKELLNFNKLKLALLQKMFI
ncbi:restriction endonuclease subunit S [uncultured Treponema sp.]|uniref:restriction endonuclease subunit S n=1 Tax=uncultured Treponema sp. TaxID=162155 RepID=UPI0034504418